MSGGRGGCGGGSDLTGTKAKGAGDEPGIVSGSVTHATHISSGNDLLTLLRTTPPKRTITPLLHTFQLPRSLCDRATLPICVQSRFGSMLGWHNMPEIPSNEPTRAHDLVPEDQLRFEPGKKSPSSSSECRNPCVRGCTHPERFTVIMPTTTAPTTHSVAAAATTATRRSLWSAIVSVLCKSRAENATRGKGSIDDGRESSRKAQPCSAPPCSWTTGTV